MRHCRVSVTSYVLSAALPCMQPVFACLANRWRSCSSRREFASASFVCVFQEVVTFSIKFARWEATIPLEVFPAPNEVRPA